MAENLRVTKYQNGSEIPNITNSKSWESLFTGAQCTYNNSTNSDSIIKLGRLYNWYAVHDSRNIAPAGWHVPTDSEWTTLENYLSLNGFNYDGSKECLSNGGVGKIAKSLAAQTGWSISTTTGAVGNNLSLNNSSGFNGLPVGGRYPNFFGLGIECKWWSSSVDNPYYPDIPYSDWSSMNKAKYRSIHYNWHGTTRYYQQTYAGLPVRCVKD